METVYCEVINRPIEETPVPAYTLEEHGTWALLFEAQERQIYGRACQEFIEGLKIINFPRDSIPSLKYVSDRIQKATGWKLLRVDGLVHPKDFFELLASAHFPSTDFIRKRSELLYTPAPDMFHDLYGHAPLLTNPEFTEFFQSFGEAGVNAYYKYPQNHEIHQMLPRIYWFTVEFGLVKTPEGIRAYGSGSCSSPQELEFCVSEKSQKHPFDLSVISRKIYDIWHIQEEVFVIDSFESLGKSFRSWAREYGIL